MILLKCENSDSDGGTDVGVFIWIGSEKVIDKFVGLLELGL